MNVKTDRRGMTLVELIVVTVLGSFVLATIYQVLVTNQRTYAVQNAQVQGQRTLRAGLEVLTSELREISPRDGDLVEMETSSIRIRAMRGLAIVCNFPTGLSLPVTDPTIDALRVGNYIKSDSARVYYENHPSKDDDNSWRGAQVLVQDTSGAVTCPNGDVGQELQLVGRVWNTRPDSMLTGAPIRTFEHYRYYLGDRNGESYLIQVDDDGNAAPLVGPLDPNNGLEFQYLDSLGNSATTEADVHEIAVTLRTAPQRRGNQGGLRQDSLHTRVYTRNTN